MLPSLDELKAKHPNFRVWRVLSAQEQEELLSEECQPWAMRLHGITAPRHSKKERQKTTADPSAVQIGGRTELYPFKFTCQAPTKPGAVPTQADGHKGIEDCPSSDVSSDRLGRLVDYRRHNPQNHCCECSVEEPPQGEAVGDRQRRVAAVGHRDRCE